MIRINGQKEMLVRSRLIGSVIGCSLGFPLGWGTGIVGGIFQGIAGVLVFSGIGFFIGFIADQRLLQSILSRICKLFKSKNSRF